MHGMELYNGIRYESLHPSDLIADEFVISLDSHLAAWLHIMLVYVNRKCRFVFFSSFFVSNVRIVLLIMLREMQPLSIRFQD
jgi:hypothetical protein